MNYMQTKRLANEHKCPVCKGLGKLNDLEPGDTSFSEWDCADCDGTGWKDGKTPLVLQFD